MIRCLQQMFRCRQEIADTVVVMMCTSTLLQAPEAEEAEESDGEEARLAAEKQARVAQGLPVGEGVDDSDWQVSTTKQAHRVVSCWSMHPGKLSFMRSECGQQDKQQAVPLPVHACNSASQAPMRR
jgi:hypothetical protein